MIRLLPLLVLVALLAACTGGPDPTAVGPTPVPGPATTPGAATPAPGPTTPTPVPATPPGPTATDAPQPTASTTAAPAVVLTDPQRCTAPEGFTISHPADWRAVSDCGQFGPPPLPEPEPGTDESPGAISAFIDPVPFHEVLPAQGEAEVLDRATTVVDGLRAVRILRVVRGESLYPAGTRSLQWLVDLPPGADEEPRTLFVTAVDAGLDIPFTLAAATADAMARTLAVDADPQVDVDPAMVIARLEGGGAPLTVTAAASASTPATCLRLVDADVDPICIDVPEAGGVITAALPTPTGGPLMVGLAAPDVARVEVAGRTGDPFAFLPVPVAGRDLGAFAVPAAPEEATRITTSPVVGPPIG